MTRAFHGMHLATLIHRPLWKSFSPSRLAAAARHARAGGLAVVRSRTWMLLGRGGADADADPPEMIDWAIHAIKSPWWIFEQDGLLEGLVRAPVLKRYREWALEWAERDAAYAGATQRLRLDCTQCAACCFDNRVLLRKGDIALWRGARRADLLRRTETWRTRRRLPLVPGTKACIHLQGNRCGIYPLRPEMCREFLPGTEHCLFAREQKYGKGLP